MIVVTHEPDVGNCGGILFRDGRVIEDHPSSIARAA